jgi:hypothetical protein
MSRATYPGLGAVADQDRELVGVMQGRFDLEMSAAADQRAAADQQLGEEADRVGLGVRGDLRNDRAGQPVIGGILRRRRPARGRRECHAWRRAGRRLHRRLGWFEQRDALVGHPPLTSATAARAELSSQIDLFVA